MKIRHFNILLGVILSCSMLSIPSYAKTDNVPNSNEEEQIDQVDNIESDNNEPDENESDDIHPMGFVPCDIKISDPVAKPVKNRFLKSGTLPSKYDSRDYGYVTSVKNQGKYGACWSFATNAALESSLIKSGLADVSIDLSELHTIYFMYSQNIDPYNRTSYDRNYISEDEIGRPTTNFTSMASTGGNSVAAGWQMADGVIPLEENGDDYNASCANASYSLDNSLCYSSGYKVKNMMMCNFDENNIENVKRLVYDYGGVAADFYCEQTTATSVGSNTYFKNVNGTKTYYNPKGSKNYSNHGIEVVGWDDNYPKDKFKNQPPDDGAWLCKNSWGTSDKDDGYIWLSYYGMSIEAKAVAFELVNKDDEFTYQYDGSDCLSYFPYTFHMDCYYLAVFTADSAGNEKGEVIDKVGVGADANAEYTISILTNPVFSTKGLVSYEEKGVTKCSNTYAGYKLSELSEPVTVYDGDKFVVCIKAKADTVLFATNERTPVEKGGLGSIENVIQGQYYRGMKLSELDGLNKGIRGSFIIKAFTSTATTTRPPTASPTPTLAPTATASTTPTATPTATVKPTITPTVKPTTTPASTDKPITKPTPIPTPSVVPTGTPTPSGNDDYRDDDYDDDDEVTIGDELYTETDKYVVTGKNTVSYKAPVNKSVKTVSIPSAVSYQGTIYRVSEIEDGAFMNCKKLKKVTIPSYVTRIGKNAFNGCKKLKTIIIKTRKLKKNTIGTGAFKGIYKKPTFKCPKKSLKSYKKWIKKSGAPKKAKYKKN